LPPNVAACGLCWPLSTPLINPPHGKSMPSNGLHHEVCIVGLGSHGIGILTHIKGPSPMALVSCTQMGCYVCMAKIQSKQALGPPSTKDSLTHSRYFLAYVWGLKNVYGRTLH
jgi:hypothetical protein